MARQVMKERDPRDEASGEEHKVAQSCAACGHIRGSVESEKTCAGCGADPASWITAEMTPGPADAAEAAIGQPGPAAPAQQAYGDPANPFSTSPPGVEGYDVNPELRVRY